MRKATPRDRARFMVPWLVAHASPDQRTALFRSIPPLRLLYWLNRATTAASTRRSPAPPEGRGPRKTASVYDAVIVKSRCDV